jgi:hypothetical protein
MWCVCVNSFRMSTAQTITTPMRGTQLKQLRGSFHHFARGGASLIKGWLARVGCWGVSADLGYFLSRSLHVPAPYDLQEGRQGAPGDSCAACVGRRVIQQTVVHLGGLTSTARPRLARHLIGSPEQARLFNNGSRDVAVPVRLKGIRIERSRQFGDVSGETVVLCRSADRRNKKRAMHDTFSGRIETALERLASRIARPRKHLDQLLLQRSASWEGRHFDVLSFQIKTLPEVIWKVIREANRSEAERQELANRLAAQLDQEFWFDITSFYGKLP